ncbi:hypothetical protein EYF80_049172 [Liparis tanakae]|uniref:Uncharacterized protein n=1 Tax=Liparis tanakae TaxID=230148 RepID=A0A4Z2FHE5_9TELE|nr:hypothetical protein EYF80_049172 [Liparis tanakae]
MSSASECLPSFLRVLKLNQSISERHITRCRWPRVSLLHRWQVQADPREHALSGQRDDLRWQESHLQLELLLKHLGDARQVEHTQALLLTGINDAKFEAHLASIAQGHLSLPFVIKQLGKKQREGGKR